MHPRRKIRDFVAAALSANVHIQPVIGVGRVIPLSTSELPSVEVYTGREVVDSLYSEAPRVEKRIVDLRVELQVDAATAQRAQDTLDDLAEQVAISVLEEETQGDVAERTEYRETLVAAAREGDRDLVGLVIGFDVTYPFEYPTRVLPDAEGIDAKTEVGGLAGGVDVESEIADQVEAEVEVDLDQ